MNKDILIGKGITKETSKGFHEFMEAKRAENKTDRKDEIKKTKEQIQNILFLRKLLEKEFSEIGITEFPEFHIERIHLVTKDGLSKWSREFSGIPEDYKNEGLYDSQKDEAAVDGSSFSVIHTCANLLHEMIHQISHTKFRLLPELEETRPYREGLSVDQQRLFSGLNEAVTEFMTGMILAVNNRDEVKEQLNLTERDMEELAYSYGPYIEILEMIMKKMSEQSEETEKQIWNKFKRGIATGEMMFLRPIEKIYGKGSLRVLAALGIDNDAETQEDIQIYFLSATPEERQEIAKKYAKNKEV